MGLLSGRLLDSFQTPHNATTKIKISVSSPITIICIDLAYWIVVYTVRRSASSVACLTSMSDSHNVSPIRFILFDFDVA